MDRSDVTRTRVALTGLGTAVPAHSIAQSDAACLAAGLVGEERTAAAVHVMYRRCGIARRHSVLVDASSNGRAARQSFYWPARGAEDRGPTTAVRQRRFEEDASPLAAQACRGALETAGLAGHEATHLVTVSCTGFSAPGVDLALIDRLGLRSEIARTNISFMGCHGALNGLRMANAFAAADPEARVLLCAIELCSLHMQYGADRQQIVSNSLFADGAAAAMISRTSRDEPLWTLASQATAVLPNTADLMSWRIGDHGFEMTLSPRVADVLKQQLRPWLDSWLKACGWSIPQVRSWAIHPGGPRILASVAEAAEFDPALLAPSQAVLADYGNMSSPTVLFILQNLAAAANRSPCVALAFGPGLTIEAALFL